MNIQARVSLGKLQTGVPGLDSVLGGGLPEYSFNLIAGGPGAGKTTLAHQVAFANASPKAPALYFTVLGEPAVKMLRYQQQFGYFDLSKVGSSVHFVNLSQEVLSRDLVGVLERISEEMDRHNPRIVIVDSFRSVARVKGDHRAEVELQTFMQDLAIQLTSAQATTFLIGEYSRPETLDDPVFTVADGVLWMFQSIERNAMLRKLQVMKMRGQAPLSGLHVFRMTTEGLEVFPRTERIAVGAERRLVDERLSSGVPRLDELLGGGIPHGDSLIVAGPSGTGKTVLATHFLAAGAAVGETSVLAVFEEHPDEYLDRAARLGFNLRELIDAAALKIIYLRPLDLSVDETMLEIRSAVKELGAKRVVIDSLSGFELALAPSFREDFRESLYHLIGNIKRLGVTVLMTVEMQESYDELIFSPHTISMLTDDIILMRYTEISGELRRVLAVVKMRSSAHGRELCFFEITPAGLVVGEPLRGYQNILRGSPRRERVPFGTGTGQSEDLVLLEALVQGGEASAPTLVSKTGLSEESVSGALDRLNALGLVVELKVAGTRVFRAAHRGL